jgi:hypothetical protein
MSPPPTGEPEKLLSRFQRLNLQDMWNTSAAIGQTVRGDANLWAEYW